ncbi:3-keto-5-aminohexanoate cleavage protein [Salinicola sp. CR57]|uniref:3-keto-5-aminohexanoate cleavage protein n=1 Tax=Salinicola sp. CR57 TaxID=1949086 RepID=UPI000DA193EE|nr:3-keto-5-aminohexanoate cleavage protein [Salinicola sp. CR57]
MSRPLIMVAPNGARRGKADHTALPVTTAEIVETAAACHAAGAHALHLHVRDAEGAHSLDAGRYRETLAELGLRIPDMKLQITTEAAGRFTVPEQLACLRQVRPAWASISVREIAREPALAADVYATCADNGTQVQHILYEVADIQQLIDWRARGVVRPDQESVLFVLGRYREGQVSSPADLAPLREALPGIGQWMVCAFGPREHECLVDAASQGGDVRVGFENSLSGANGQPHADNAASVGTLVRSLLDQPPHAQDTFAERKPS